MTEGIVNILKPPGMTSSDAVADVRHIFKIKRVGHTGTLDPGAAGVLPFDCLQKKGRRFYRSYGSSTAHFVILSGEKCRMLKNGLSETGELSRRI